MIQAREQDENVEVYARMQGGEMTGMLVISAEPKQLTIVHLDGPVRPRRSSQLEWPCRTAGLAYWEDQMIRTFLLALLIFPSLADNDFDSLVRNMESNYGSKRLYIPFMGLANFIVKVARPVGTKDFKLAVFEHVDGMRHPSTDQLDATFLPQGWKPFVRVVSRKSGERIQIYARESHRDHELLITTFERDEAVMVRLRVNAERLAKWVNNPALMCRSARSGSFGQ